ncbi:hypothetical protein F5144DRAFT_581576 [Chaetomium tenue]|uniref:Uncharacterized protein n=1 Tax=Chaetomium tenue TaxID=1854479 RepID=A0ACB7NXD1_9PEZI|nr:hypothetical protein F5144DRAFT_581576 [Chaetomium globosum]
MAPELRKRKSKPVVAEPEPVAKKSKATKSPKAEKRKAPEDASPVAVKKQKPTKDVASKKVAAPTEKAAPKKSALKKERQSPKAKAAAEKSKKGEESEEVQDGDVLSEAEEEEVDDDTKALVQALDSGDEDEAEAQVSTFKKGQDVGKVPKAKKSTKAPTSSSSGTPGVMYLARIPHGFYEHELRSYFGQFGDITRLRVVRNKKTGASRHRAFVEFADAEVADIAARTMDKYLLFGHILSAKTVPPAQVHPDLFKGANRRFKVVPWNKMAGKQLERPLSESQWQVKISKEEQRRAARADKLKEMGYEFEAPALKAAEAKPLLENGTEEEPKAIEAPPATETAEPKEEEEVAEAEVVKAKTTKSSEDATPQKKKGKKAKKTKS